MSSSLQDPATTDHLDTCLNKEHTGCYLQGWVIFFLPIFRVSLLAAFPSCGDGHCSSA